MNSPAILVRVLGSGTSTGVPVIGCNCPVCASPDPHDKRLRSSVAIQAAGKHVLIDCSTDFRQQMLRDPLPRIDALLLTHSHSDHVGGIDELRVYNYLQQGPIPVYGDRHCLGEIEKRFGYVFNPRQLGGGVPRLDLCPFEPGRPFVAAGLEFLPVPVMHGILPIVGYRLGPFAYVTDCSAIPPESEEMLRGLDTLILSALRPEPHPTHFSLDQSLEVARRLAPRRVFFTHMADRLLHEETNRRLPDWAKLLHDGQIIEVAGTEAGQA
jgi:phosphoribosyl 1,2-cyclic phosphate phosphodiesterase